MDLPKGIWRKFALLIFSFIFIYVGFDHFINPEFYLKIMPPRFPFHLEAVLISGFFEILGGVGILISTRQGYSAHRQNSCSRRTKAYSIRKTPFFLSQAV